MKYGLIGEKLGHSFSKEIHKLLGEYEYALTEIPKSELGEFMRKKDFLAINVTIPYKQAVIPYLDEVSAKAEKIGAVNTIVNKNGKLFGYNTDYYGFNYMLSRAGIDVKDKVVALLGTGGASKMARLALSDNGAKEIITVSRSGEVNYNNISARKDIQVIINATPMGMFPNNGECLIDANDFPNLESVADMVYNPCQTELIFRAKTKGVKTVNGLPMLVAQAKYASELFFDSKIPDEKTNRIITAVKKQTLNVTLVGMPSSGKTSIGKKIAKILGREFIDADEVFEERYCHAGEYIEKYGEQDFRDKEQSVLYELTKQSKKVISTGGGGVLRAENRKNIKSNSIVVWVKRDINKLSVEGRPLSKDLKTLNKMYIERAPIYQAVSDLCIENDGDIDVAVNELLEKINDFNGEDI